MVESVDYSGVIYEKRRPNIIKEKLNWSSKQIFRDLFCFSWQEKQSLAISCLNSFKIWCELSTELTDIRENWSRLIAAETREARKMPPR